MSDDVERALSRFGRDYSNEAESALLATGPAGLRRLVEAFFGNGNVSVDWPVGRESVDRFHDALSLMAKANRELFVQLIQHHDTSGWGQRTVIASLLAEIGDPQATFILCEYLSDPEWLVRSHAIRALDRTPGDDASRCIDCALDDAEPVVQVLAMQAVSRRNRARALTLYKRAVGGRFVRRPSLPPDLHREAKADFADLKAGRAIPATRPWRLGPL